jgi:hypothetical protein
LKEPGCIPEVSSEFVCAMEEALDVYAPPYDPDEPRVCFDEMSRQLLDPLLEPLPMEPGVPRREDYEDGRIMKTGGL